MKRWWLSALATCGLSLLLADLLPGRELRYSETALLYAVTGGGIGNRFGNGIGFAATSGRTFNWLSEQLFLGWGFAWSFHFGESTELAQILTVSYGGRYYFFSPEARPRLLPYVCAEVGLPYFVRLQVPSSEQDFAGTCVRGISATWGTGVEYRVNRRWVIGARISYQGNDWSDLTIRHTPAGDSDGNVLAISIGITDWYWREPL